jgi:methionyl-tRNA formyltransferase
MTRPTAILIVRSRCRLNEDAIAFVRDSMDLRAVLESADWPQWKESIDAIEADYVFNFLSDRILKGAILERKNVNFHPAPPEYPGRGTASYALFDNIGSFGACAHVMAAKPDAGPILKVRRFPIGDDEGCESVSRRAELACLDLLQEVVTEIARSGALPPPCGAVWKGAAFTRKQFEEWLMLDPADPDAFARKVRAARHSKYPGPFVTLHGYRFGLISDD